MTDVLGTVRIKRRERSVANDSRDVVANAFQRGLVRIEDADWLLRVFLPAAFRAAADGGAKIRVTTLTDLDGNRVEVEQATPRDLRALADQFESRRPARDVDGLLDAFMHARAVASVTSGVVGLGMAAPIVCFALTGGDGKSARRWIDEHAMLVLVGLGVSSPTGRGGGPSPTTPSEADLAPPAGSLRMPPPPTPVPPPPQASRLAGSVDAAGDMVALAGGAALAAPRLIGRWIAGTVAVVALISVPFTVAATRDQAAAASQAQLRSAVRSAVMDAGSAIAAGEIDAPSFVDVVANALAAENAVLAVDSRMTFFTDNGWGICAEMDGLDGAAWFTTEHGRVDWAPDGC